MSDVDFGFVAGLGIGLILAVGGMVQGWVAGKKAGIRITIDYLWGHDSAAKERPDT